jgi:hypothetical protein
MSSNPALTVVLVVDKYRERAQRMLRSVLEQDIADQISLLVYDRADQTGRDLPEFHLENVVYEAVDRELTLGQLQKRAILTTSSDIIAFIEEHVAVPPGWARESLRRHAEGYAGVTGSFVAGNPQYRTARVIFSITYGNYILPHEPGEATQMPGDNSSFVRSKLLKYKDDLELLLNTDNLLVGQLIADGEKLYRLELSLKHWNEDRFWEGWIALFYWNQMYILNRVIIEKWTRPYQLLRFLATPLVPFVRTFKGYKRAKQNASTMKEFFADLPLAFLYHTGSALGMLAGFLLGYQNSVLKFTECESAARRAD